MKIDPGMRGRLPRVEEAVPWASPDGIRKGWKLTVPGNRPLATPAVAEGRVFLGGGFGSHDFYALDAVTGSVVWQYQTEDDGPTAAVVADGFVAFNTESCELEVLTTEGRPVWKKWLGDPLMSMPAVDGDTVYQAFPDSRADRRHYLGAFALRGGEERWRQPIHGEVITGPVASEGHVYVANLDGTLCCFRSTDGERIWQEQKNATTSPVVREGQCYFSQRREVKLPKGGNPEIQQMEHLAVRGAGAYGATAPFEGTVSPADYLDHAKRMARSPHYAACEMEDGAVGFAAHKGDAKMEQARGHLGHGHVSSLWAYQGSKPFLSRGRLFGAVGDTVHCADPDSREVFWKTQLYDRGEKEEVLDNVLTPPAVVNGKLFVGTIRGEVCCLSAGTGEVLWRAPVGEPVVFQPAVVGGHAYVPTWKGSLFRLATGDPGDDGWCMWGGNAAHNGIV